MSDLTKQTVTVASRRMLRRYPVFFAVVGCSLLFTSEDRLLDTPAFAYADTLVDLRAWGAAFAALGVSLALCWWKFGHRGWYARLLSIAAVWMYLFAAATFFAAIFGRATFAAWAWAWVIAEACLASLESITSRETGEPR